MAENGNNNGNGLNLEGLATIARSAKGVAFLNLIKQIKGGKKLTAHDLELLNEIEKESNEQQEPKPDKESVHRSEPYFETQAQVLRYLQAEGWKIKKSALSNHVHETKLKPDVNGGFTLKAVVDYARIHLARKDTLQKLEDGQLQRTKLEKEIQLRDEEIKFRKLRRMIEEGKYILKEDVFLELAARAAVLEAGYKGMLQARAGDFIEIVGGNEKKTGDLIRAMTLEYDSMLNEFAKTTGFQVVLEGTENGNSDTE